MLLGANLALYAHIWQKITPFSRVKPQSTSSYQVLKVGLGVDELLEGAGLRDGPVLQEDDSIALAQELEEVKQSRGSFPEWQKES